MDNTKIEENKKEQNTSSQEENLSKENAVQTLLGNTNFIIAVIAVVVIAIAGIVIILARNSESDNATYVAFEDSEEYTFEYPDTWIAFDNFGTELQPEKQYKELKKQEEEIANSGDDFDFSNLSSGLETSAINVTIKEDNYNKDLQKFIADGECEDAVEAISGGWDLGQEYTRIESTELNGTEACVYDSTVNFFVEITGTTYIVLGDKKVFIVSKAVTGEDVKGVYKTQADKILESFTLL